MKWRVKNQGLLKPYYVCCNLITFDVTLLHFLFCRVTISCPLCEHDVINENEPIRMEAVCPECVGNSLVSYEWKLFFVEGYPTVHHWDSIQCMHPGKSQFELWRKQNTSEVRDWMNKAAGQHMKCMQHWSRSNWSFGSFDSLFQLSHTNKERLMIFIKEGSGNELVNKP